MTPIATALLDALLAHHSHTCRAHRARPPLVDQCVITYGQLVDLARVPIAPIAVGTPLAEVATWCAAQSFPPLNALAVNGDTRMPGDKYNVATGCSLLQWPQQAAACIVFEGYPARAG